MLEWCRRTLNTCKTAVVTGAVAVTGAAVVGTVCRRKLLSWQHGQMEMLLKSSQMEQFYLQHHNNMTLTLTGYFVKLKDKLNLLCDTETTLQQLKEGKVDKLSGWTHLRKQVLSKLLLAHYSSTLLCVFLSVQLTIVKATIVRTVVSGQDVISGQEDVNRTTKTYLSKVNQLLDDAVPDLLGLCEDEIERVFSEFTLDSKVRYQDLAEMVGCVNVTDTLDFVSLCNLDVSDLEDELLRDLDLVTMDVLESQDFRNTFTTCLEKNRVYLLEEVSSIFQHDSIVLAKLLPPLNKIPTKIMSSEKEEYVSYILNCELLKALCCSIHQGLADHT